MKYKIGTVARLLGVSPQTLRLYEQNGILTSERGEGENGYRYYSRLDITALMRARAYHQYGFSMKETEGLINAGDVDYVLEEYRRRARELEAELFLKQRILEYLRQMSSLLERLPGQLWTIRRAVSPGIYRLEFMKGDQLILTPEQMEIFPHWVGLAPFAFPSQRNSWEGILRGQDISYSALGVMEEDARALDMPAPLRGGVYHPPFPCLCTVVEFSGSDASCAGYMAHLRDYTETHGITVTGDPICRTFLSMNKKESYRRFRQVWLPIAPD